MSKEKRIIVDGGIDEKRLMDYLDNDTNLTTSFYNNARKVWQETQEEQIQKGMEKYPEPFNPHSWTPKQLLKHAMQENVDQAHYIVGMYELLEEVEAKLERLKEENKMLEDENYHLRGHIKLMVNRRTEPPMITEHAKMVRNNLEKDLVDSLDAMSYAMRMEGDKLESVFMVKGPVPSVGMVGGVEKTMSLKELKEACESVGKEEKGGKRG